MKTICSTQNPSKKVLLILLLAFFSGHLLKASSQHIDLKGKWQFSLDSTDIGIDQAWYSATLPEIITLPGTTDDAGKGIPNTLTPKLEKPQILRLTRKNSYVGAAWYNKAITIPRRWDSKQITLKLERVIWQTTVWIDGNELPAVQESLSTPHYFDLTPYVTPGSTHQLSIRVDNRKKYDISVHDMGHAYTNETQIIWNGIIGEISCIANDKVFIQSIQVFPDVDNKKAKVNLHIINTTNQPVTAKLNLKAKSKGAHSAPGKSVDIDIAADKSMITIDYPMGNNPLLWDEFQPNIYTLNASIKGTGFSSAENTTFGMRQLTNKNAQLQINGNRMFLRGTLECNIFPLTGYPPMDHKGWEKVFGTAKSWGLNHIRFHSWCPPKAAFEVADRMGMYLQVELPLWSLSINKDEATNQFLFAEANHIIREYGNHPSFCFWSLGNELQPDFNFLNRFVDKLKAKDPRHLYTNTAFTFEAGHGKWPEPNDDFFITQYTDKGWVRGQGIFGSESPRFNKDYSDAIEGMPVPIITHEIGQYSVYPNLKEIKKYTGVLEPLNFKAVALDLKTKGLESKADDFVTATGKFAALLYKEEIERAMKTPGVSGFQLLDLRDFPGQGTALVGLVDAFWDSKGVIENFEFREFTAPVVPLVRFSKAVFNNNEHFDFQIEIANYSIEMLRRKTIVWEIIDQRGKILKSGKINRVNIEPGKLNPVQSVSVPLKFVRNATQLTLKVRIDKSEMQNRWKIWVYPHNNKVDYKKVVYTRDAKVAQAALLEGRTVLYNPDWKRLNGIEGKYLPVFWSPVHFPRQAATMGILCDPKHKALADFPTAMHSDWQWWDLNTNSTTVIIDSIPQVTPIVSMIDNWVHNRRLAIAFETKVGKGKLLYTSIDLETELSKRPQAQQLLISFLKYMNSSNFRPKGNIQFSEILSFEKEEASDEKMKATDIY